MPQRSVAHRRHQLMQLSLKRENKAWLIRTATTAGYPAPSQLADDLIDWVKASPIAFPLAAHAQESPTRS